MIPNRMTMLMKYVMAIFELENIIPCLWEIIAIIAS
jgi:hypothetical protein